MWIIAISFFLAVMLTVVTSTVVFDLIPNLIPEYAYYTKMLYGGSSVLGFTVSCFLLLKVFFTGEMSDNVNDNQNTYFMIKLTLNALG